MRGIVAPATPCCPRTSAAAFNSLRSDSRLRCCCGSSVFLALGMEFLYSSPYSCQADRNSLQKDLDIHNSKCKFTFTDMEMAIYIQKEAAHGNRTRTGSPSCATKISASSEDPQLCSVVDRRHAVVMRRSVLCRRPALGSFAIDWLGGGDGDGEHVCGNSARRAHAHGRRRCRPHVSTEVNDDYRHLSRNSGGRDRGPALGKASRHMAHVPAGHRLWHCGRICYALGSSDDALIG